MKVTLLSYTHNPDNLVATAAKLCYSSCHTAELVEKNENIDNSSFIEMIMKRGHESPLEHISFTFGIDGVSRSLLTQITRHRIASYSVQSQRYVKSQTSDYVIPPEILNDETAKAKFLDAMEASKRAYDKLTEILKNKHKQKLESEGEIEADKKAEKMAIEDARYVLPNAWCTNLICTFNARSLLNFFSHRCCNRTQWEIRSLAWEMLRLVVKVAPGVFRHAGPVCLNKGCPEGKMGCGKAKLVRETFNLMIKEEVGEN